MIEKKEKEQGPPPKMESPEKPKEKMVTRFLNFTVAYNNFIFGLADWIIELCGIYVFVILISQFKESNLTVGIALIAILTALGSSCFGYSRAIDPQETHREKIVFSGERLLHGAVLGVLGLILKLIQNNVEKVPWAHQIEFVETIIQWLARITSFTLFVSAVVMATRGIRLLNKTLHELANRHSEWMID